MIEQVNNINKNIVKAIVETYNYDKRAYKINKKKKLKSRIKTNEII